MHIEATKSSPYIKLSAEDCEFRIEGSSYSESVDEIYDNVIKWVEEKIPELECELNCIFKLYVLSSVSQKKILYILIKLNEFFESGKKIKIIWYVAEDDEDNYEFAEEIGELFNIPVEIIKE